ncbi:hypothetical protein B1A99_27580 [Cohnella sp. CIP 111063]|uniref:hypothetical protein n=1 Tax=unclassified Cohnella TaxID=2636738 RepID=UPI000B8C6919|nr:MULTISPECIES: hypothetical protein [unclassified Cohnella]OXS53999.1 hypothetical protein B1A99_27580 [Cohnella sp. CIP 111063]PRX62872.1 cytoskeletal protein CcmA (bactofilin family) [Cohnella sp. SGD-V74]
MNQPAQGDLVINGVSTASGGQYGRVKIDGVGTVEGDIVCADFDCNGMTKIRGSLAADTMDADGMFTIDGHLSAARSFVDGHMKVRGSLKGDSFSVNGLIRVDGNCEIESFRAEGAFEVGGLLNVGTMDVLLQGRGKAGEIGGESIRVVRKSSGPLNKLLSWFVPRLATELHVESIEGDVIDLEYTQAEVVRGNRVRIGKGCTIGLVEYRTEFSAHPGAKIGKEAKVGD